MGQRARSSATRGHTGRRWHTTRATSIEHTQRSTPPRRRNAHPHPKTQRGPRLTRERVYALSSTTRQKGDDTPDGEKHSTSCGDDQIDPAMTGQGLALLRHIDNNAGTAPFLSWGPQG